MKKLKLIIITIFFLIIFDLVHMRHYAIIDNGNNGPKGYYFRIRYFCSKPQHRLEIDEKVSSFCCYSEPQVKNLMFLTHMRLKKQIKNLLKVMYLSSEN